MFSSQNFHQPEFYVLPGKVFGTLTGRLYVRYPWTELPAFLSWYYSVRIIHEKPYRHRDRTVDKVIYFEAPFKEYYRLSLEFPHSKSYFRARTYDQLRLLFTELDEL